ncbi:MAG: hypothetical protein ACK4PR_11865 [Gammaproteobacteria bacterium]
MFRLFNFMRAPVIQKKLYSSLPSNYMIKNHPVDEKASCIKTGLDCNESHNYKAAITRGYALLGLKKESAYKEALQAFDEALKFNSKSLSAHLGKSLIFNQLDSAQRSQEIIKHLEKHIPNYLDLLSQLDSIKPLPSDDDIICHQTGNSSTTAEEPQSLTFYGFSTD